MNKTTNFLFTNTLSITAVKRLMGCLIFLAFIKTSTCYSQKTFHFDYLLEYEYKSYKDSANNKTFYYITNSKDNSYYAKIEKLDSVNFKLDFKVYDQLWTKLNLNKQDFLDLEFLRLTCDEDLLHKNYFKELVNDYKFYHLTDTISNNIHLKKYNLQYIGKRKRKKTFPVATFQYIIKDSTQFHMPILIHWTAFARWRQEKNLPNGIFQEKIVYNYKNEISYKYILKEYHQIDKTIVIPNNCLEKEK